MACGAGERVDPTHLPRQLPRHGVLSLTFTAAIHHVPTSPAAPIIATEPLDLSLASHLAIAELLDSLPHGPAAGGTIRCTFNGRDPAADRLPRPTHARGNVTVEVELPHASASETPPLDGGSFAALTQSIRSSPGRWLGAPDCADLLATATATRPLDDVQALQVCLERSQRDAHGWPCLASLLTFY